MIASLALALVSAWTEGGEKPWAVGGFVDVAYLGNSNTPRNHVYRGTVMTPRTGEFSVNNATAYIRHEPNDTQPFRLELGLQAGAAPDALFSAEPTPGGAQSQYAGVEVWKHLALANAGFYADKTGTEVGGGLFASPIGIGGFWTKDNWNYSPSWESNAAPYYLVGARVMQQLGRDFVLHGYVVNGWQTAADVNRRPSYVFGWTYNRGAMSLNEFVFVGPEQSRTALKWWRWHADTNLVWNVSRFGIGAVWDVGGERDAHAPSNAQRLWMGGGLFTRLTLHRGKRTRWEAAMRPEAWWDRDGIIFGVPQWLASSTATLSAYFMRYVTARLEYRYDRSTSRAGYFFVGSRTGDTGLAIQQHTVFISLVGHFEHVF